MFEKILLDCSPCKGFQARPNAWPDSQSQWPEPFLSAQYQPSSPAAHPTHWPHLEAAQKCILPLKSQYSTCQGAKYLLIMGGKANSVRHQVLLQGTLPTPINRVISHVPRSKPGIIKLVLPDLYSASLKRNVDQHSALDKTLPLSDSLILIAGLGTLRLSPKGRLCVGLRGPT